MKRSVSVLLFTLSLLLYQLSTSPSVLKFHNVIALEWDDSNQCAAAVDPQAGKILKVTLDQGKRGHTACRSRVFAADGDVLELAIRSPRELVFEKSLSVEVKNTSTGKAVLTPIGTKGARQIAGEWRAIPLSLPRANSVDQYALRLISSKKLKQTTSLELRSRADVLSNGRIASLRNQLSTTTGKLALSILVGFGFLYFGQSFRKRPGAAALISLFILIATLVHFRFTPFFMWDEWHVIQRFRDGGFETAFHAHNEHFVPLFFLLYYLEIALLRNHYELYLLFSLGLHALNSFLVVALLEKFLSATKVENTVRPALYGGLIFLVSGLNGEVIQWAFEPCVLLLVTAALTGMISAIRFVETKRFSALFVVLLSSLIAPFFFANGLILPVMIGAVAAAYLLISQGQLGTRELRPLFYLGAMSAAGAGCAAVAYSIFAKSESQEARTSLFGALHEIGKYIFVGGELGTILRGFGLLPAYELTVPALLVPREIAHHVTGEIFFAFLGLLASLLVLGLSLWRSKNRLNTWTFWILGQSLILVSFALPAVGRWQFGVFQSLSLRYHALPLIGFVLMILPLLVIFTEKDSLNHKYLRNFLAVGLFVIFAGNLFGGSALDYFTGNGQRHRLFIAELRDWSTRLNAANTGTRIPYEGTGTELEGLFPLFPETLTPGKHPDEIENLMNWLSPRHYPARS